MRYARENLRWNGWGPRDVFFDTHGRDRELWALIADSLGLGELPSTPALPFERVRVPEGRLSSEVIAELGRALGGEGARVRTDDYERAFHALGQSYPDALRARRGELGTAPDAVLYVESEREVLAVLALCDARGIAAIPFGGGSSVVGGVEGRPGPGHIGAVTIDTTRLRQLLEVDPVSHTARAQAGIYGPVLEEELGARGFTLGHYPQSFEFSTLGGWIAARGAGQLSNRYGSADKFLVAARLATPRGELRTLAFPTSAAGPNLNHVIAGSEGTLGVITEATVKVHPAPEARRIGAFLFRELESGTDAVRRLVQEEVGAAMIRLSDPHETRFFGELRQALEPGGATRLAERGLGLLGFGDKCLMLVAFEGSEARVRSGFRRAVALATRAGGLYVGEGPGRSWWKRRFEMPYLRDPILDHGLGVDTVETSTEWSNLPRLYHAVREALRQAVEAGHRRGIVMMHVSHSYLDGASLYFTFLFARDLGRELEQWHGIKEAASRAISENGGTISHHHGVGVDHAGWMRAEKGALGMDLLAAAKARLDPNGIMNPGKLLGPRP